MALTRTTVKRAVRELAREAKSQARTHNDWHDTVFQLVDDWWGSEVGTGRITDLDAVPTSRQEIEQLMDAVVIMQTALEENWGIADDSGLWEGLAPFPALMSQAFFTFEQAVGQQEPRSLYNR